MAADEEADLLVDEIGRALVADEAFRAGDWASIALVATVREGRSSLFGFRYLEDGSREPSTPEAARSFMKLLRALRDAMARDGKGPWAQCLVQARRADRKLTLTFEYDDPRRWTATPANLDELAEAMRPR